MPLAISAGHAAIGGVSVLAGTFVATRRGLPDRATALIQHAAAGTVLAGLVIDVLARLMRRPHQIGFTAAGMVAGLAAMLAIRAFAPEDRADGPGSLVPSIAADVLIDGILIGLSAALGAGTALLFAISLAPEMSLLGVTAADRLRGRWSRGHTIAAAAAIGFAIIGAGCLGGIIARTGPAATTAVLGAGSSVIIYLIMEELLREAHETDTGPVEVAILFGSFLPLFLAGIAIG